jgi:cytochrome c-type biogenesis protein
VGQAQAMTIEGVPLSLAFVSGGLAALNPCGFPLLPAFLSFYVGAGEARLPRAPTRVAQGLAVGLLVTAGFLGLFTLIGLPITFGATAVARTVPLAGIALGIVLSASGLVALSGRQLRLPAARPIPLGRERRARTIMLFGLSYGLASLGCTLPVFLTLVGSSIGTGRTTASVVAFAAYGLGMAVVLMALSVAAALAQQGLARWLRRFMPYLPRVTGGLLVAAGAYLTYYWWRIRFGARATLASDPIVGGVIRYTSRLTASAEGAASLLLILAGLVVAISAGATWVQWRRRTEASTVPPTSQPGVPDAS